VREGPTLGRARSLVCGLVRNDKREDFLFD